MFRPIIPSEELTHIMKQLLAVVKSVLNLCGHKDVPRQLLNIVWSFARLLFQKWPDGGRFDTQANTNKLRRHLLNMITYGPNGENIRAAQGLLQNLRGRSFNVFIGKLLPLVLGRSSLNLWLMV